MRDASGTWHGLCTVTSIHSIQKITRNSQTIKQLTQLSKHRSTTSKKSVALADATITLRHALPFLPFVWARPDALLARAWADRQSGRGRSLGWACAFSWFSNRCVSSKADALSHWTYIVQTCSKYRTIVYIELHSELTGCFHACLNIWKTSSWWLASVFWASLGGRFCKASRFQFPRMADGIMWSLNYEET